VAFLAGMLFLFCFEERDCSLAPGGGAGAPPATRDVECQRTRDTTAT